MTIQKYIYIYIYLIENINEYVLTNIYEKVTYIPFMLDIDKYTIMVIFLFEFTLMLAPYLTLTISKAFVILNI